MHLPDVVLFLCNTAEGAPNNGPIGTRKDFRVMEVSVIDSRAEESRPFFSEFRAIGFGLNQFSTLSHVYEMHGLGARLELLEDDQSIPSAQTSNGLGRAWKENPHASD